MQDLFNPHRTANVDAMDMNPGSQIMTYPEGFSAGERGFFAAIKVTITSTTVAPGIGKCNKNKVPIPGGPAKKLALYSQAT